MNKLYRKLNRANFSNLQNEEALSLSEKERIRKHIESKKPIRKSKHVVMLSVTSLMAAIILIGTIEPRVLANVPWIGSSISGFLLDEDDEQHVLDDYVTVVGTHVEDKDIEVTLNEVMYDNHRLIVSTTFYSTEVDLTDYMLPMPHLKVNGEEVSQGASGQQDIVDEHTVTMISSVHIDEDFSSLLYEKPIEITYSRFLHQTTDHVIEGEWSFAFATSGAELSEDTKVIDINETIQLDNGQVVEVDAFAISPGSSTLHYTMYNNEEAEPFDWEYDVIFKMSDQDGNLIPPEAGQTLSENSFWQYGRLSEHIEELTFIPIVKSGREGEAREEINKRLTGEEIQIKVKQ
ncbi:DUF4179 domain-containing protein [Geomicrobium sp. JCM 19055]|uniref:DUF4179 domain-containing protein n=1 Tax=Geomicrobium sp. JCM 19055 TaxID=1460649 RepID=UPI00045ED2BF|nr:DUF4179 domain-containing protein [Geomicrobium sp. JCM 19055]GAK00162.1 ECF-type sigma factor negative effector [Geomicrobium sp. JCM 19055]